MNKKHIAIVAKRNKPGVSQLVEYAQEKFTSVSFWEGAQHEPFPEGLNSGFDILISYLSPWIIPRAVLDTVPIAINFHPAPPEYPGIGCFNFALNDKVTEYGITCHHMAPVVDTGAIIAVSRFPVTNDESVLSLSIKSYAHMHMLCIQILDCLSQDLPLPQTSETWQRKPFKRTQLEELCRVSLDIPEEQLERVVNATTFPGMPGAYFEIDGRIYSIMRDRQREKKILPQRGK